MNCDSPQQETPPVERFALEVVLNRTTGEVNLNIAGRASKLEMLGLLDIAHGLIMGGGAQPAQPRRPGIIPANGVLPPGLLRNGPPPVR